MVSPDEREELAALRAENARLIGLLVANGIVWRTQATAPAVADADLEPSRLSTAEKVALFRRLFRGAVLMVIVSMVITMS